MSVIATSSNTVTATIPVGTAPIGVAFTPDGTEVYVANNGGTVSVISTATNLVTNTVTVGGAPIAFGLFIGTPAATSVPALSELSGLALAAGLALLGARKLRAGRGEMA